MTRYECFSRDDIRLLELGMRGHDLSVAECLPLKSIDYAIESRDFGSITDGIEIARSANHPVVLLIGGHPIKLGLSRFLVDLMERELITHLALNGAGIIHDYELALVGGTSEDVAKWIKVGQFGLWEETSRLNDIIREGASRNEGLGECVGRVIDEQNGFDKRMAGGDNYLTTQTQYV